MILNWITVILCTTFLVVGCTKAASGSSGSIHWCNNLEGDTVLIDFTKHGLRGPIKAKIIEITTDSKGCWYHVRITDDPHIQPRSFLVYEDHIL